MITTMPVNQTVQYSALGVQQSTISRLKDIRTSEQSSNPSHVVLEVKRHAKNVVKDSWQENVASQEDNSGDIGSEQEREGEQVREYRKEKRKEELGKE